VRRSLLIGLALALAGCTAWRPLDEQRDAAVQDGDGGAECPPVAERPTVVLDDDIVDDRHFTCAANYEVAVQVHVTASSLVTIDPGVVFRFRERTALIVERGSVLRAIGTADSPIVMTSALPVGSRSRGDWVGVALLGRAPVHGGEISQGAPYDRVVRFGGGDPAHDCGTLRYVRIELAGGRNDDGTMGALSLQGCGSRTTIDHLQLHGSAWEGLEIDGGTTRLRYVAITDAGDEAVRVQNGWRGGIQYLLAHSWRGSAFGFELDNDAERPDRTPVTRAYFVNATFLGFAEGRVRSSIATDWGTGATGILSNAIVMGWNSAVDFDAQSWPLTGSDIRVERSFFDDYGTFSVSDSDGDEEAFVRMEPYGNVLGDPLLVSRYVPGSANYVPRPSSNVAMVGCPDPGIDESIEPACYAGAFAPGGPDWMAGWTDFPVD
jgi:hypothetical protein